MLIIEGGIKCGNQRVFFDTITFFDQNLGYDTGYLEVEIGIIERFDFARTTHRCGHGTRCRGIRCGHQSPHIDGGLGCWLLVGGGGDSGWFACGSGGAGTRNQAGGDATDNQTTNELFA